jgi:hypothetical protein
MNKLLLASLFFCSVSEAFAQTSTAPASVELTGERPMYIPKVSPKWTLTVDPLTTALGFAHIQVEHVLTPKFSIYLGPHLHVYPNLFSKLPEDYIGVGAELGLRRFFNPNAPKGLWVQVRGVLAHVSLETEGQKETKAGGYVSGLFGYTWIHNDRLVLAGGAGVQYINYQIGGQGLEGVFPALHTNIGFAF